ncbi:conserved hypothetical protein [Nitrosococcus halophilus Nc 4]|uniref:Uncharacterized protein n=2 Tax=Nitrosococcus halophilus TaxID=133539 RepID=D5C3L3_NITHN|nr:conserved hypothetical protein [Nitrosococcus halophilus Nc 4]
MLGWGVVIAMGKFSKRLLGLLILILFLSPVAALFWVVEDQPASRQVSPLRVADAHQVHALAHQFSHALSAERATTITAKEHELNSLMAWLARGIPRLSGQVNITSAGLNAVLTLSLPSNLLGDYVNLRGGLKPSITGLQFTRVALGQLELNGDITLFLLRSMLNIVLGNGHGATLLEAVRAVIFRGEEMTLYLRSTPEVKAQLAQLAGRLEKIRDKVALLGDPDIIRIYYTQLVEIQRRHPVQKPVSLAHYIGALFQLARERSRVGEAAAENQAAILALAIYFGDARLERLTGPVRTGVLRTYLPQRGRVHLANRRDLMLHFILSAALKIAADKGMAMAIGEFKELLDAASGGSGYSFVDLAADRAGIRFAEQATDPSGGAEWLQKQLAGNTDEAVFFPKIAGLPEGLTKQQFTEQFPTVESPAYQAMVEEIDRRIGRLPAYASG